MKLLLCVECQHVMSLDSRDACCRCGRSGGCYETSVRVKLWGRALLIGLPAIPLEAAVRAQLLHGDSGDVLPDGLPRGREIVAFIIPEASPELLRGDA